MLSTYQQAVSPHDGDFLAQKFIPDAAWEIAGPPSFKFEGAEAGPGVMAAVNTVPNLMHMHTPAIIVVNGNSATARSIMYEFGDSTDGRGYVNASGLYEDELVKIDGVWKLRMNFPASF